MRVKAGDSRTMRRRLIMSDGSAQDAALPRSGDRQRELRPRARCTIGDAPVTRPERAGVRPGQRVRQRVAHRSDRDAFDPDSGDVHGLD